MSKSERKLRDQLEQLANTIQVRGEWWSRFAATQNISASRTAAAVCTAEEAKRCACQLRVALGLGSPADLEIRKHDKERGLA